MSLLLIIFILTVFYKGGYILKDVKYSTTEGISFGEAFEKAYSTHLFGNKYFVALDNGMDYLMKHEIESPQVMLGENDWLFYISRTDGDPYADYVGIEFYSENKMRMIAEYIIETDKIVRQHGKKFVLLVCPNKESIYGDFMPDSVVKINTKNRTDRLIEYLRENTGTDIIYPKENLERLSTEYQLYYKYDTHWNCLGSYVAFQDLLTSLYGQAESLMNKQLVELKYTEHESAMDDLARMLHMRWFFHSELDIVPEEIKDFNDWREISYKNENALFDEKILLIGDSFRVALKPYLSQYFEESLIISRDQIEQGINVEFEPDVVVLEYVERYSEMIGDIEIPKNLLRG